MPAPDASPAVAPPVLEVRDLHVRLPRGSDRPYAVEAVDLAIGPRETLCIVGESGSGKSVTASAVMGLLPKVLELERGRILLSGRDITHAPLHELRDLRGNRMAMVFQEPMTALNPAMRVGDQIAEAFEFHAPSMGRREVVQRVLELLADVHLPAPETLRHSYPHQLSGGQRQRVMIAMALAMEPRLIIADEPTTALDVTSQAQVLRLLHELRGRHSASVLFITHDFDVVAEIADRVVVMQSGRIVESGSAEEVLRRPRHDYTKMLLASVPDGSFRADAATVKPEPLLVVEDLQVRFETAAILKSRRRVVQAVAGVSFELARGETLGVVGESGSGKTTLGRCLARLTPPTSGRILLGGQDLARMSASEWQRNCKKVQMVFQDPFRSFNPRLTVRRALSEGPVNFGESADVVDRRMREMLALVRLDASAIDRYPHEFSGGQRQRLSIARALMMEPELLVADEAVSALDVSVQAQILSLLEDIRDRLKLSIVFITHDLRVAARLCHRILVMQRGVVVEEGEAPKIFGDPRHAYTRELLAAIPGQRRHAEAAAEESLPAG
jgi:peptide/nickel transport system ATP-binding protein